jgi:hypothetical protein
MIAQQTHAVICFLLHCIPVGRNRTLFQTYLLHRTGIMYDPTWLRSCGRSTGIVIYIYIYIYIYMAYIQKLASKRASVNQWISWLPLPWWIVSLVVVRWLQQAVLLSWAPPGQQTTTGLCHLGGGRAGVYSLPMSSLMIFWIIGLKFRGRPRSSPSPSSLSTLYHFTHTHSFLSTPPSRTCRPPPCRSPIPPVRSGWSGGP